MDPATAGTLRESVHFAGKKPSVHTIDMSSDPACVEAHHGKAVDETVVVNSNGTLANVLCTSKPGLKGNSSQCPPRP